MVLLLSVVMAGEFYLVSWLNKTNSSLSTQVRRNHNVSLASSQWGFLK